MGNPTSEWQTLVIEASQACKMTLSEEIESYLVFLLMRFTQSPQIAANVMALDFIQASNQVGIQKSQNLRDVGDKCLLYSGLFPERAQRRRVRVSYYVNLGQSAYSSLAKQDRFSENNLFAMLSRQFVSLMDILQSMRELDNKQVVLDPITAEELWHDTGSNHALHTLEKFTLYKPSRLYKIDFNKNKH